MATNEEYESLRAEQRSTQSQYNATQRRIQDCEYKISRLKRTKETLTAQKRAFQSLRRDDENLIKQKRKNNWTGTEFRRFQSKGNDLNDENARFYKNSLDGALDAVNNEITRLENQKYSEYGLLGRLSARLNSLANRIENLFN